MPIKVDSLVHRLRDLPQDRQLRSLSEAVDGGDATRGAALEAARRLGLGSAHVGALLAAAGADGRDRIDEPAMARRGTTPGAHEYAGGYHDAPATHHRPLSADTVLGARLSADSRSTSARALAAHWDRHLDNPPFAGTAAVLGGALHSEALLSRSSTLTWKDWQTRPVRSPQPVAFAASTS